MSKHRRTINHAIFDCGTCGKSWQGIGARKAAYSHAKSTGHYVAGEVATSFHYNGEIMKDE